MDAYQFRSEVEKQLEAFDFVKSIRINANDKRAEGRVTLVLDCFLKVFYNATLFNMSFSLISNEQRIWAIDLDTPSGWHRHPLYNVQVHEPIDPMTIEEIIDELAWVLKRL